MDDFRFTPTTATTAIPYWIEPDVVTPKGFWVKVTTITTSGTSIYMYYGNADVSSASNKKNVFILVDDFNDSSIDTDLWISNPNSGSITEASGYIRLHALNSDPYPTPYLTTVMEVRNAIIECDAYAESTGQFRLRLYTNDDASSNNIFSYYDHVSLAHSVSKTVDGVGTTLVSAGGSYAYSTWHHLKLIIFDDGSGNITIKNWINDALLSNATTDYATSDYKLVLKCRERAADTLYDNVRIRKYAATEPTISSVGSEQGKYYLTGNYKANVLNSAADGTKVHQVGWNPTTQSAGTDMDIYVRASNTTFAAGDGTPAWTSVSNGEDPSVVGRYIQWMSTFTTTSSTTTPKIEDITLTYTSPPTAPSGCANTYVSDTQIDVSWTDNSTGQYEENYFKIEKSTDGGAYGQIDTDTASPYSDTTTSSNKKYQYQIRAYNTAGNSAYSTAASPVYTTPAAPTIGTPVADSSSQITWNWTNNSAWEDGFKIYCATSTELRNAEGAGIQIWAEAGLTPNTTYQRYVKSYNGSLYSAASGTAEKVTLCNVPVSMTIASPSYTQVELNWNGNGNPAGTKYIAHCSPDGFATVYSSTVTATTATFSSLTRNTEYAVRVYAVNHAGETTGYLGPYNRRTQPGTFQEKTTTRTGKNSYGFEGDGVWTWDVPANGGSEVKITAYARYNSDYGAAVKPKITLYNYGINESAQATVAAEDNWEKLTVSGTPSGKGVLFLKVEGFSTAVGAKYFVDDIQVNQP